MHGLGQTGLRPEGQAAEHLRHHRNAGQGDHLLWLFQGACGACHHEGDGPPLVGANVPLALVGKVHSDRPDNLIRTILDGVPAPPTSAVGFMPALRHALDDRQVAAIVAYLRERYAPGRSAWADLEARLRALHG